MRQLRELHVELGFCECYLPEDNAQFVVDALKIIAERYPENRHTDVKVEGISYESYLEKMDAHFGNRQSWTFFMYWADTMDLTEHGGGVGGRAVISYVNGRLFCEVHNVESKH